MFSVRMMVVWFDLSIGKFKTAEKNLDGLQSEQFLEPLRAKGRFRPLIESMTIRAVIDPEAGLFSAACRARDLAESGGTLA